MVLDLLCLTTCVMKGKKFIVISQCYHVQWGTMGCGTELVEIKENQYINMTNVPLYYTSYLLNTMYPEL